jgi:uncharacterized protein with HEPN domain
MQHDSRAYLWDVRQAADAILDFVAGLDWKTYADTQVIHAAVERKFQIIGEALNQLSKADPALAARIPDLTQIVAFRNVLIHGYAVVEHPRVWRIIQESLPPLHAKVVALLDELGPP